MMMMIMHQGSFACSRSESTAMMISSFRGLVNVRHSLRECESVAGQCEVRTPSRRKGRSVVRSYSVGATAGASRGSRNWGEQRDRRSGTDSAPGSSGGESRSSDRVYDFTEQGEARRDNVGRGRGVGVRGSGSSSRSWGSRGGGLRGGYGNSKATPFSGDGGDVDVREDVDVEDFGGGGRGRSYRGSSSGNWSASRTSGGNYNGRDQREGNGESQNEGLRDSDRKYRGSNGYSSGRGSYGNSRTSFYSGERHESRGARQGVSRRGRGYIGSGRGYRGSVGSSRGTGRGRYDALRREAERKMHSGAYEMVDPETGEKVIVWGADDSMPKPSPDELKWKPTTMAIAGDVSEEGWYKAMEASMGGPSGAFSVKGVRQGGVYNDGDEEDEEDYDDNDLYESDDDDEEELFDHSNIDSLQDSRIGKPMRPVKIRLFGRTLQQKDDARSESSQEVNANQQLGNDSRSDLSLGSLVTELESQDGVSNTRGLKGDTVDQPWSPIGHVLNETYGAPSTSNIRDRREHGEEAVSDHDAGSSLSIEESLDQPWPPPGPLLFGSPGGLFVSRGTTDEYQQHSSESSSAAGEKNETSTDPRRWPPKGVLSNASYGSLQSSVGSGENKRSAPHGDLNSNILSLSETYGDVNNGGLHLEDGDDGYVSESNKIQERASVDRTRSSYTSGTEVGRDGEWQVGRSSGIIDIDEDEGLEIRRSIVKTRVGGSLREDSRPTKVKTPQIARKDVEHVSSDDPWQQGGMNPGIIEIDEDGNFEDGRFEDRRSSSLTAVKSNLLEELRIQTHRKLGTKFGNEKSIKVHEENQDRDVTRAIETGVGKVDRDSSGITVVRPRGFRDLKARKNFDPSLAAEFFSQKSYKDLGASEEVICALTSLQVKKPSAIQALAFKPIIDGQSCIVADQTGTGKTLAYVAPLVQRLRAAEAKGDTMSLSKKPCVLVLVPTSELAVQVLNVCRAFSKGGAPFRSIVLTGGFKWKTQCESLAQGADVVIATPGRFLQHLQKGSLQLDNLKTVVLDEVDILLDDQEFSEVLESVEQAASMRVQYVHVTATLPVDIHDSLLTRYPDALPLMGPSLHRMAVGLQEILVDCSGAEGEEKTAEAAFESKKSALLQLVDQRPVSKSIIFCNKIETCRRVENVLARHDRSGTKLVVLPYHAALSREARLDSMQQFLDSQPSKSLFFVCTDRASRGLDSFDVEHVILFDYPRDPSEYVRRVGRTARGAGGTGKVFVFALGKQVGMARNIMARNEKGRPIHDVPGSQYET